MVFIKSLFLIFIINILNPVFAGIEPGAIYKDWRKSCETQEDTSVQSCHIFQALTTKSDGKLILHVAVGTLTTQQKTAIIFTLPLGVGLAPGISFKIDDGEHNKVSYNVCSTKGCIAGMNLTDELIDQLKAGHQAKVSFANTQSKVFTVPVSLRGFTAGFNALSK